MEKDYFSKEWDDAPMPNAIFFTPQGHAIHGSYETRRLGSAVSHGCIRIAPANAAILFALVRAEGFANTQVVVTGATAGVTPKPSKKSPRKLRPPPPPPLWGDEPPPSGWAHDPRPPPWAYPAPGFYDSPYEVDPGYYDVW